MDADLCMQIQCGAVSQQEAGLEALLECSQAGMVGVKGCGHPECAPYVEAMRAKGICPQEYAPAQAAVIPEATVSPVLPVVTATFPSITPRAVPPPPVQVIEEPWWCPINRWASQNRVGAVLVLAGVYVLLAGWRRRVG